MYKNDKVIRRYSEPFKLKILAELSTGKHTKVETKDEISRIKALQKEIEQLKKLLLKKDLDAMVQDSYLEVAAEDLGYKSVNELKKKLSIKP